MSGALFPVLRDLNFDTYRPMEMEGERARWGSISQARVPAKQLLTKSPELVYKMGHCLCKSLKEAACLPHHLRDPSHDRDELFRANPSHMSFLGSAVAPTGHEPSLSAPAQNTAQLDVLCSLASTRQLQEGDESSQMLGIIKVASISRALLYRHVGFFLQSSRIR